LSYNPLDLQLLGDIQIGFIQQFQAEFQAFGVLVQVSNRSFSMIRKTTQKIKAQSQKPGSSNAR